MKKRSRASAKGKSTGAGDGRVRAPRNAPDARASREALVRVLRGKMVGDLMREVGDDPLPEPHDAREKRIARAQLDAAVDARVRAQQTTLAAATRGSLSGRVVVLAGAPGSGKISLDDVREGAIAALTDATRLAERRRRGGDADPGASALHELGAAAERYLASRRAHERFMSERPLPKGPKGGKTRGLRVRELTEAVRVAKAQAKDPQRHLGLATGGDTFAAVFDGAREAGLGTRWARSGVDIAQVLAGGLVGKALDLGFGAEQVPDDEKPQTAVAELLAADALSHRIVVAVLEAVGLSKPEANNLARI